MLELTARMPFTTNDSMFPAVMFNCRSVVRHFGILTEKNHLMFVEALFQHPHPQPFCETLHNVYREVDYDDQEVTKAVSHEWLVL